MKKYLEVNKTAYDDLALDYYDRSCHVEVEETSAEMFVSYILPYLPQEVPYSKMNVLEIGPGSGKVLAHFSELGFQTTAVELSPQMAKIAVDRSPRTNMIIGDVNSVKLKRGSYDIVFMGAVFHLFPVRDAEKLLHRVGKWLKPDGILFVNTTCSHAEYEGYFVKQDYVTGSRRFRRYWTEKGFFHILTNNKFKILTTLYSTEHKRNKNWIGVVCRNEGLGKHSHDIS